MSTEATAAAPRDGILGHPRGLLTLSTTEMWERFSYYGMRALLVLFMVEAVEEGVTALLSEEKDVAGLADDIACLLENASLRHNMGLAGRNRVEQHFDLRKQCAKLESIYAKLS